MTCQTISRCPMRAVKSPRSHTKLTIDTANGMISGQGKAGGGRLAGDAQCGRQEQGDRFLIRTGRDDAGNEAPAGKRQRAGGHEIMDSDVAFATPAPSAEGLGSPSEALEVQSRDATDAGLHDYDEDEFDLDGDDADIVAMLEKLELDHAATKQRAEQQVRLVLRGEDGKMRLVSPSQFEAENKRWPNKADYDAHPVLIKQGDAYVTKPQYYSALRAECETPEQYAAATSAFKDRMDQFGMSHESFAQSRPATGVEGIRQTPDGQRETFRVPDHPVQAGADLPNLLITHTNGQQTLEWRNPDHRDVSLDDLLKKYGKGNVALRDETGAFRTVDGIERSRAEDPYKLRYPAAQLYKSYADGERPLVKAFGRATTNSDVWVAVKAGGATAAEAGRTQLLLSNPRTGSLLSPQMVSQTIKKRPDSFEGKSYQAVLEDAHVNPKHMNSPNGKTADILVRTSSKTLVSAEKLAGVIGDKPMTDKILKKDIHLQNYGIRYDKGVASYGPTGNYASLESRERQVLKTYKDKPPAERYARLYHSLAPSQQEQLALPAPDMKYEYLRTAAAREASLSATSRSGTPYSSQREGTPYSTQREGTPVNEQQANMRPELSVARQMSRAPRSSVRGD